MAPIIRETDGIVLDSREHGESDLIMTLYCRKGGRVSAIAKGAKRSKRRFVNKLELFSFLHLTLREQANRSLSLLTEAELHSGFIRLRHDIARYTAASVIREIALFSIREGEEDEQIYSLLLWALHRLDLGHPHLQVVMFFLLKFYDYIGYRPELARCSNCRKDEQNVSDPRFSLATGGLLCDSCSNGGDHNGIRLSLKTLMMLRSCQDLSLKRLHMMKISEQSLYESLNMLHKYGRHILQRDIISWKMLRQTISSTPYPPSVQR